MKIINVLFALIIAVGLFLPFVSNANAIVTTANFVISAAGDVDDLIGGFADIDDPVATPDDDATVVYQLGGAVLGILANIPNHTVESGDISQIQVYARYAKMNSGGVGYGTPTAYQKIKIGGTVYNDAVTYAPSTSWANYSTVWATNPNSGVAWTWADIDSLQIGCFTGYTSGSGLWSAVKCTQVYVVVSYENGVLVVTTQDASAITATTATGNGNITSNGGETITEKGICYKAGSSGDPTTADSTSHDHVDSIGAYTEAIAGLTKGTAYRLRAYAINAIGTGYGTTVDLVTIDDPTITTQAASLVSSNTARLNSQVTFDGKVGGGEACTVTFVYVEDGVGAPYADYAAVLAEGGSVETAATGTWSVGQFPYLDIAGLTLGGDYSFAVKIVNSTTTAGYGGVLTFTTASGVSDTTGLTAIPTATTVSLSWVKGVGASYTLVRYSASAYPTTIADGVVAYLGTSNSYMLIGLTPGTTYYFSAWGKTGALYSAGYVTALATTLAYDTAASTGTIEAPPSNSWWNQTPSTTKVSSIPLVSGLVSANATAYAIPEASLWYFLWVLFSVGIGVFIYAKSGNNLPMSLGAQALLFALGAVLGLVMLWIMVLFMVIGAGFALWGDRR